MKKTVINYHITEYCNFGCKFCFAKYGLEDQYNTELHHRPEQVRGMLKQVLAYFGGPGKVRINFVGGEPFLVKNFPEMIDLAVDLGFEVSFVTNGTALTERFLKNYARKLSMIGISIDSFTDDVNRAIGRVTRNQRLLGREKIMDMISLSRSLNPELLVKLNTVVCEANYKEDMSSWVNRFAPDKWKIFRVLPGENKHQLLIGDEEFLYFVNRHKGIVNTQIFAEDNDAMTESYIMIDPLGRFVQNSGSHGALEFSSSILDVGVTNAFSQIVFSKQKYEERYIPVEQLSSSNSLMTENAA